MGNDIEVTMAPPYVTMLEDLLMCFSLDQIDNLLEWKMAHSIPLELDEKPPFKLLYRLNPLELHGIKT